MEAHHLSRADNVVDSAPRLEGILAGGAEPLKEAVPGFPGATTGDVDSELGVPEVALEAQPPGTKLQPACSPLPSRATSRSPERREVALHQDKGLWRGKGEAAHPRRLAQRALKELQGYESR